MWRTVTCLFVATDTKAEQLLMSERYTWRLRYDVVDGIRFPGSYSISDLKHLASKVAISAGRADCGRDHLLSSYDDAGQATEVTA